jgi:hypothetical protein
MKKFSLYSLFFAWSLLSCNRGVYISIDNTKYDYGKNTVVTFQTLQGSTIRYNLNITTFKKSYSDSSFFLFNGGRANIPMTAGNYSFPNNDRVNLPASGIEFYDNFGNQYVNGGDEIYGPTFIITSLTKKRVKGYFKSKLGDIKADTIRPSNTIYVEGRFNVSLKNALHQ